MASAHVLSSCPASAMTHIHASEKRSGKSNPRNLHQYLPQVSPYLHEAGEAALETEKQRVHHILVQASSSGTDLPMSTPLGNSKLGSCNIASIPLRVKRLSVDWQRSNSQQRSRPLQCIEARIVPGDIHSCLAVQPALPTPQFFILWSYRDQSRKLICPQIETRTEFYHS